VDHRTADSIHSPWLQRYAVFLAAAALFSMTTGAVFTANEERPLYSFGVNHLVVGTLAGLLASGLAVWLTIIPERLWLKRLAWVILGAMILESGLGLPAQPLPPVVRLAHAFLAQVLLAAIVSIAVFTSRAWKRTSQLAGGKHSLGTLAALAAGAAMLQVALGVAFRHGFMGVMPHIIGALVAAIFVLALAMSVIYIPEHEPLRPAGVTLLIVTAIQVFLGLALLSMELISDVDPVTMIVATMIHAATSALTLAAVTVMALLVWRSIPTSVKQ